MRRLAPALLILLLAAPSAEARKRVLGSSLQASATRSEAHPVDTAFWPQRIRSARRFRAPADGQVLAVRLKGSVLRSRAGAPDPFNQIHFQSLRPLPDGSMRVLLTSATFLMPIGGARDQVTTYRPENLCVPKGGVVGFNDSGGFDPTWYPNGARFRVFGRVAGSITARDTAADGTNNGDTLRPTARRDSELLMQVVLGTGRDVGGACRGYLAG